MGFFDFLGFGKKKSSGNSVQARSVGEYPGPSRFGLAPEDVAPLSKSFINQLLERSQGNGLVGFDPRRRKLLQEEFLADLGDTRENELNDATARAAGQGLRGGIPLSIADSVNKRIDRERTRGLNAIDIEDLQARRDDINKATYSQMQPVQLSADIAAKKFQSDLGAAQYQTGVDEYNNNARMQEDEQGGGLLSALTGLAGTYVGAKYGPQGLLTDALIKKLLGQNSGEASSYNRSFSQYPVLSTAGLY